MANRRQRIVFGVFATIAGLAVFDVASAFVVSRGLPYWLAAVVGGFAFPLAPLTWHLLAERRRRRAIAAAKTPPKASLTPTDRYMLRFVVVTLAVLGPMIAVGKLGVAKAVWKHGLWFWPTSYEPTTTHGGPLSTLGTGTPRTIEVAGQLARVPADAELVITVRQPDSSKPDGNGVLAWGDRQALLAMAGDAVKDAEDPAKTIAEINKQRSKLPWLPIDELVEVKRADDLLVVATERWRFLVNPPGAGPSKDILRELGRAPSDAFFAAAFVPKTTRDAWSTRAGAAWMLKRGEKLVLEGRVEATDEAAAKKLVDEAKRAMSDAVDNTPEQCREQVGKLVRAVQLDQTGAVVTGRLEVGVDELMPVMFCALKE